MPTRLERALLADMIADLDQQQLKDIFSHLGEASFSLVAESVMAAREKRRARPMSARGNAQASGSGINASPMVEIQDAPPRPTRTFRPASGYLIIKWIGNLTADDLRRSRVFHHEQ
jgi:hypothetical protein